MSAKKFWLAVFVQILVLFAMIGSHMFTLSTGRPIMLKTAPVDPWDPFRGDYVVLSYEISTLTGDKVPMTGVPYRFGDTVWVTLQSGNPFWTAVAVSNIRPAVTAGQIAVKGEVQWYSPGYDPAKGPVGEPGKPVPPQPPEFTPPSVPARLMVHYGIEQFYVPEGQGKDLQGQQRDISVEAVVDSFGRAALHKVFVNGKEIVWN